MAEKKVIFVVESTAAMGPYWETLQMEYLNKIVKSLCGNEPSVPKPEFALVTYNTHGCYSPFVVQRSGCTRDPDVFLEWLSSIHFSGGGFNDAAIVEGLAEALVMFPPSQSESPNQQNVDMQMHCILVAASNPHPLKTPVFVRESIDSDTGNYRLYDAEDVAKVFPQFSISLSVICPRQLLKIKAIYNAGKRNNSTVDPPVDAKTTHHLIMISEGFREAHAALNQSHVNVEAVSVTPVMGVSPSELPSVNGSTGNRQPIPAETVTVTPTTVKIERGTTSSGPTGQNVFESVSVTPVTGAPPSKLPSTNGSIANRQPIPAGTVTPAAVKVEPVPVKVERGTTSSAPSVITGFESLTAAAQVGQNSGTASLTSTTSNLSSSPNTRISQPLPNNIHGAVSTGQQVRAQIVQGGVKMSQNVKNVLGLGQSGVSSGSGAMIPTPGMPQQVQSGANNTVATNMPLSQQTASAHPQYIKVWEGSLSGLRQGQSVFITKLEGFRNSSASETLAANWPPVMLIVRLIPQDFMNNKQFVGKTDLLVFRALNPHGFIGQLKEKKQCAVIQLPSQTLLLSVSDKACRLIGMLFPKDIVAVKPPLSSQQQQQQMQQQQISQQQHQQLPQKQQMVGSGIGQTYVQGHGSSQVVSDEQVSSQGATNIGGRNFMS